MTDAEKLIAQFQAERAKIVESAEDKYLAACMEQADADALAAAAKAQRAAQTSLELVRSQLDLGQVNVLALLSAQQAYQQTVIATAQAQTGRLTDTAALFQALGGGWWNRNGEALTAR